ncbi:AAA family ATPase [Dactylococcopsis salina]|uniref:AAA family ATPase n=1 Tax=Dactylococcopsis salina TaxID=292566 RepID=UPI0002D28D56|nr:AAA family ATPase [Dactylococcopsis salina]
MNYISPHRIDALLLSLKQCETEKDVENKVVKPFLHILGYTTEDYSQQALIGDKRVDFLIKNKRLSPHRRYLLIEVKSAQQSLKKFSLQIKEYLQNSGTLFGILTNGSEFIVFYNNCGNIHLIDQFSLSQIQNDSTSVTALKYLSKTNCEKVVTLFTKTDRKVYNRISSALIKQFQLQIPTQNNGEKKQSMIITVFNNKGGVGKTTMTINLAAALNRMGKKVLLIDIDSQANLTTGLGIDPLEDVQDQGKKIFVICFLKPRPKLRMCCILNDGIRFI